MDENNSAQKIADLIIQANNIVFFTGAGVSTESGIPDFRSPDGIWSKFDPEDFTFQKFMNSRENRKLHWQVINEGSLIKDAEPNQAHIAIAELEDMGKLSCIITQNIDGLHQKAGNSPDKVCEIHGNMKRIRCMDCDALYPVEDIVGRVSKEEVPDCPVCMGILKPDAVFFGESLPQKTLHKAINHARNCDLFIIIGSTLIVYPAAEIPWYAREAGAKLVIINIGDTPMDSHASVLANTKAGDMMSQVMKYIK